MFEKIYKIKNSVLDIVLNLSPIEVLIRKSTDSDFDNLDSTHYKEICDTMRFQHSFENRLTINYLVRRIEEDPEFNPIRVFKCLDLLKYMLLHTNSSCCKMLQRESRKLSFLKRQQFIPSSKTQYLRIKINSTFLLIDDTNVLNEERKKLKDFKSQLNQPSGQTNSFINDRSPSHREYATKIKMEIERETFSSMPNCNAPEDPRSHAGDSENARGSLFSFIKKDEENKQEELKDSDKKKENIFEEFINNTKDPDESKKTENTNNKVLEVDNLIEF
ncbi:MAG: hypothetical protein MHMPM18_002011 [Marteilia pararefringens]